jgi:glyceraldehyde-3-phosphate dehydrogenase/erythrose-4-phosphate dehydrogenase
MVLLAKHIGQRLSGRAARVPVAGVAAMVLAVKPARVTQVESPKTRIARA